MNKLFSFALMAVFFVSCQSTTDTDQIEATSETTELTTAPVPADANNISLNPVAADDAVLAAPAPAAGKDNAVALNPEHGMPGHRCELPVGAPLNSAPAAPAGNNAPAMMQAQPAAPAMAQPATGSNQKLNPPHGQPGHDCAVAVGAPLNG